MPTSKYSSRTSSRWGTSRMTSRNWRTNNTSNWTNSYRTGTSYSPTQFSNVRDQISQRMCSYRTIFTQCSGPGKVTWFSPTTANKWVKMINNGCLVYKFNNPDFCRSFGAQFRNCNTTTAFRTLRQRFGTGIKAVCRGKNNCWLICASTNVSGRPFNNYNWK